MSKQLLLIQDAYDFGPPPPKPRETPWEKLYRFFFGDDVFISYARADATRYVPSLAARLAAKRHLCFFDQLAADPSEELPERLKKKILRSTVFILIGTRGAVASSFVRKEVELFRRTRRPFIPVDVDGALAELENWREVIGVAKIHEQGARVREGDPSPEVISLIKDSFRYTRRSQWLRASLLAGMCVICITVAVSLLLIRAAQAEAVGIRRQADAEVAEAHQEASEARQSAQNFRAEADRAKSDAEVARKQADKAAASAASASAQREAAEQATRQAQELERQSAERAADTARREAGSRATLLSREPGMERDALTLAVKAAKQSVASHGDFPDEVMKGIAASAVAADYSLPLEDAGQHGWFSPQISPNGEKIFASLYEPETLSTRWVLWDVRTGRSTTLVQKTSGDAQGAFSRDARRLAVASEATSDVRIWDLSGPEPRLLETGCGRGKAGLRLALDSDGSHLAFVKTSGSLKIDVVVCEIATGREEVLGVNSGVGVGNLAFTPDGEPAMNGNIVGPDLKFQGQGIYFLRSGRVVALKVPGVGLGDRFLGFGDDGSIVILKTGPAIFMGPDIPARVYIQSPDGDLRKLTDYKGEVYSAAFYGGRARVVTVIGDKVRVADAHYSPSFAALRTHLRPLDTVALSPDNRTVLTIGGDGAARLWDVQTGLLRHTLMVPSDLSEEPRIGNPGRTRPAAFLPDGSRLAMMNEKGEVQIWDVGTGRPTCSVPGRPPEGRGGGPVALSFAAGGDYVMAHNRFGLATSYVSFIDARTCQPVGVFDFSRDDLFVSFSADGSGIITGTFKVAGGWELRLWSLRGVELKGDTSLRLSSTGLGHGLGYLPVLPSAGGPLMLIDRIKDGVYVWEPGAKTSVRLEGLQSSFFRFYRVTFSADRTRAAAVTGTEARVWDTRSGKLILAFECDADILAGQPLALSPDGSRLLIAGKDNTARIYPTSREGFLGVAKHLLGR